MSDSKTLLKNTLIYTAGNFGAKILSFLLIPLYSYFLTKSQLGMYDLIITSVQLLLPVVSLQMNEAVYRWLLDCGDDINLKRKVLKQSAFIMGCTFVVVQVLILIVRQYHEIPHIKEFSFLIFTSSILPFLQQITRGVGKTKLYSLAGILNSIFIFGITILFLYMPWFEDKVQGIFYSLIIANVLTSLFLFVSSNIYFRGFFETELDFELQKSLIRYSLPLVLNTLSWWVINASDRYIILEFLNIEDNGIYAISTRLPSLLTIINTVFMLAWQDLVISDKNDKNPIYSKVFNNYISFNLTLTLILIAANPLICHVLFDINFFESWKYAPFLYLGSCFSSLSGFLGAIYLKSKQTKGILITSAIAALINIIISAGLINLIGLHACVLGTFFSFLTMFIIRYKQTVKVIQLNLNVKNIVGQTFLVLFFTGILLYFESLICSALLTFFAITFFYIINKTSLKTIFTKILNTR
ncbi:lipopolysaccharide biosynthesis protein [Flavobacterium agrisoli]|uniref:Oligosaccharide flippase family protein n=1 Tax=Flavobacterium agrisoli TaxID=2793066 RepID=A0A934PN57_9FLAO|nr:oligosaccharide flippase family protein [Flavobacterium agrisoli]MBK0371291.1 oligosaccharide flippase family protein [Flavobacterium agrisoli]